MVTSQKPESALLYVKNKGRVRGPFLRDFIDAMILSGHFSTTIEVSLNGQSDWTRIASAPVITTPLVNSNNNAVPPPSGNKNRNIVGGLVGASSLVGVILLVAVFSSTESTKNKRTSSSVGINSTSAPIQASTPRPVSTPIISIQSSTTSSINQNPPRPTYSHPSYYNPSLSQSSFNDNRGTTYTYRQSQAYTLNRLDQVVREKKGVVASYKQSMDAISAQIKADRPYIDHSSQSSVDQFNYKVDRYNDLRLRYNSAIDDMNAAVDQFNAELHRIGTPVRN